MRYPRKHRFLTTPGESYGCSASSVVDDFSEPRGTASRSTDCTCRHAVSPRQRKARSAITPYGIAIEQPSFKVDHRSGSTLNGVPMCAQIDVAGARLRRMAGAASDAAAHGNIDDHRR